jgi:hypothetical protein
VVGSVRATVPRGISARGLSDIPLPHITVLGAGEEKERIVLGHDALYRVRMAFKRFRVGVSLGQSQAIWYTMNTNRIPGPSRPLRARSIEGRMSRVFDIEYTHVVCGGYNGSIVGVGHELDGKDVGRVTGHDRGGKVELRGGRFGVIGMDVDAMVVGA